MAQRLVILFLATLLTWGYSAAQHNSSPVPPERPGGTTAMEPKEMLQRETPAIVAVYSLDRAGKRVLQGTGFIVRSNGVIVTNYHVVRGGYDAQIQLKNGELFENVTVLYYDVRHDVIVLKIQAIGLPTVTLGGAAMAEAGDRAYAIGNPEGFDYTISDGLVSARRVLEGTEMLQITVPISHGSSGGPLYNTQGQVIGITTAGFMQEGAQNLNFAVPLKYLLGLLDSPPRNMTLAQLTTQLQPPEVASATPPKTADRMSNGGIYSDPSGLVRLKVPPGWTVNDPPPKEFLVSMNKGDQAVLFVYQSDQSTVDREFALAKQIVAKEYGEMKDCTKVQKADKEDQHVRMQVCAVTVDGKVRLLTISALQNRGTIIGAMGISTKDAYESVLDAIGALEF